MNDKDKFILILIVFLVNLAICYNLYRVTQKTVLEFNIPMKDILRKLDYQGYSDDKHYGIIFVSTDCSICRDEAMYYQKLYSRNPQNRIFLAFSGEDPQSISNFYTDYNLNIPFINDVSIFLRTKVEIVPSYSVFTNNSVYIYRSNFSNYSSFIQYYGK